MPGISDTRINGAGKMSFSGSKSVSNGTAVSAEIAQGVSASTAAMLDLQGRITLLEAKLSASTNEAIDLAATVADLANRLAVLETPSG